MKAAVVAAFRDGKIPTRGQCHSYHRHDTQIKLGNHAWAKADVGWEVNKFSIPHSDQSHRRFHTFSDVEVHREGLDKWINSAADDSQRGPQESAEGSVSEEPEEPEDVPSTLSERAEGWLETMEGLRKTNKISWRKAAISRCRSASM